MSIREQFAKILEKINKLDECAKNPFLHGDFSANPFKDAFSQTYVWVEEETNYEDA